MARRSLSGAADSQSRGRSESDPVRAGAGDGDPATLFGPLNVGGPSSPVTLVAGGRIASGTVGTVEKPRIKPAGARRGHHLRPAPPAPRPATIFSHKLAGIVDQGLVQPDVSRRRHLQRLLHHRLQLHAGPDLAVSGDLAEDHIDKRFVFPLQPRRIPRAPQSGIPRTYTWPPRIVAVRNRSEAVTLHHSGVMGKDDRHLPPHAQCPGNHLARVTCSSHTRTCVSCSSQDAAAFVTS
jgi:hypothetical protein